MSDPGRASEFAPTVFREVTRPRPAAIAGVADRGVATLHEAMHFQGLLDGLTPLLPGTRIAGPAVTVLNHPGDNLMIHAAIEVSRPGDVLVVSVLGSAVDGMIGDLLATLMVARGISGVVIDSGVRDVPELRRIGLPIWCRAVCARGTGKSRPGWVNVPVVCGGVAIRPGDVVVADDDGVVAIPADRMASVGAAARHRDAAEAGLRTEFVEGTLSLDAGNGDLRRRLSEVRTTD